MKFLDAEVVRYSKKALASVEHSRHMNALSEEDLRVIKKQRAQFQRFADALLVDFINYVLGGQGVDYAMYTKDLKKRRSNARK